MGWFFSNFIYDEKSLVRACCVIGLLCSGWNLFADLYFMDFFTAHMSEESMGLIRDEQQSGYLFNFRQDNQWLIFFVQASGWMYPIWAVVTAIPLCIGFQEKENEELGTSVTSGGSTSGRFSIGNCKATFPIALLVYGLCVVGGAFHNAFAFITVLPNVLHYPPDNYYNGWSDLIGTEQFSSFLTSAQTRILQFIFVGALPGLMAYFTSSVWIALLVHFRPQYHRFPKWFNLFNPVATQIWVNMLGSTLPDPIGFYFNGCFGTWGLLFLNLGTTYCLLSTKVNMERTNHSALLQQPSDNSPPEYKSFGNDPK